MRLDNFFIELERLMANGRAIVAIEGGSASGKTTLASVLENKYKCTVFHMDDFFLRPEQRNKEYESPSVDLPCMWRCPRP